MTQDKKPREFFLCDGHAYTTQYDANFNTFKNLFKTKWPVYVIEYSAYESSQLENRKLQEEVRLLREQRGMFIVACGPYEQVLDQQITDAKEKVK